MSYAERTKVPIERSIAEATKLVERVGAQSVGVVRDWDTYVFAFKIGARSYRYDIVVDPDDPAESRRRWRVLVLQVKTRVTLIEEAGEPIEAAFMPFQVLPDGRTVHDHIGAQLAEGRAPPMIPYSTESPA